MHWIMLAALAMTLLLAFSVLVMVAFIGRHGTRRVAGTRWERAMTHTNRVLNAQGTPPRFLERLDQR